MHVKLLFASPITLIIKGIRKCWKSDHKSDSVNDALGPNDLQLMKKIIKLGHTSTLEHSLITYEVNGISRALLQESSRHRISVSPSVESTRYTFKRVLDGDNIDMVLCNSGSDEIDEANKQHMENIKRITKENNLPNDVAKYGLVEAYKTNLILSFNLRSLMHFYKLRSSKKALEEIRNLAEALVFVLPDEYKQFFDK